VSLQRDRADVENALGRKLTADEFRQLRDSDDWDELQSDRGDREMAIGECVYFVQHLGRMEQTSRESAHEVQQMSDELLRVQATSLALWEVLSADAGVRSFRGDNWGDGFTGIGLDDVELWKADAGADALERLSRLVERLADRYPIQPNQVEGFILCDAVPIVPPVRVRRTHSDDVLRLRIVLDVDPDASADQVVAAFREARAELVGDRRRPSPSNLKLLSMWISLGRPGFSYLARTWNRSDSGRTYLTARTARTLVLRTLNWVGGVPYE
jgi:hypothetical protein